MALNFSDNFLQTLRYEDESAPTTPDIEKDTMSEAITKGILRGGQQLYEGAGSALQYLGNRIGNADLAEFGKEHAARGREVGEWFEPSRDIAKSYFGEDSTDRPGAKLAYDIANMGVSMAPALIAAGATMGSSLVPPAASRLVASIVGGAIGGMQEGTSTYQEMMKRGAPESDAARGLESMAAGAGILNAISMGKILSKSSGGVIGAIKKGLASGVTEATTEYLEEPLEVGIKKNLLKPEQFTEKEARDQLIGGFDVMPASFVLGALTGGIAGLSRSAPSPPSPTARDYARTPADEKAAYQEYFERPAADPASLVSGANNLYNNLIAKKASPDQQLTGDEQALISLLAQIKDDPREVAKYYGLRLPMRNETPADHGTIVEYLSRKQAEQEASKATAQAATQEAPPAPPPVDLESQGIPTGPVNITAPSNPLFGYPSDTEAAQLAAQNQAFNQGQAEMTGDIEAEKILRQQVPREIAREREAANIQGVDEGLNEMVGEAGNVEVPASATPGVLNQPETPETPETPKISETPVVKESLAPESAPADTTVPEGTTVLNKGTEKQPAGLNPVFSDIHAAAKEAAKRDNALDTETAWRDGKVRTTEGAGMPYSETRKQWDMAYQEELNRLKEARSASGGTGEQPSNRTARVDTAGNIPEDVSRPLPFKWNGQPSQPVKFVAGEYAGMTGKVIGQTQKRYSKEADSFTVQVDGFPKPGGWDGKVHVGGEVIAAAEPTHFGPTVAPQGETLFAIKSGGKTFVSDTPKSDANHGTLYSKYSEIIDNYKNGEEPVTGWVNDKGEFVTKAEEVPNTGGLRYDPSTNKYNGETLVRGDILTDAKGNRYALDRQNGYMLSVSKLNEKNHPSDLISLSVDPKDTQRFLDVTKGKENLYEIQSKEPPQASTANKQINAYDYTAEEWIGDEPNRQRRGEILKEWKEEVYAAMKSGEAPDKIVRDFLAYPREKSHNITKKIANNYPNVIEIDGTNWKVRDEARNIEKSEYEKASRVNDKGDFVTKAEEKVSNKTEKQPERTQVETDELNRRIKSGNIIVTSGHSVWGARGYKTKDGRLEVRHKQGKFYGGGISDNFYTLVKDGKELFTTTNSLEASKAFYDELKSMEGKAKEVAPPTASIPIEDTAKNVGVGTGGIRNASEVASTKPLPAAVQDTIAMYSRKPFTRVSEAQLQNTAKAAGAEVFVSEEQSSQQRLSKPDLEFLANQLLGNAKNRPDLIVVEKASELPFDALEDAQGVIYDGKIYLVSSNIPTVEDAKRVIFHELVGHYGLRGFFGNRLDSTLDLIYNNNPLIRQYALDWMKNNRDLQLRYELSDLDYHYRAIEEAMAKMAQQNKPFSFAKRLLSAIQSLLRKVGLNKLADTLEAKSNAEALAILDKSRLYISKGAAIDSKMPSPAFAYFSRAPRKITPKSEKKPRKTLRDITDLEPPHATAPLPTIPPEQISDWMKDNSLYALSQFKQMLPKNTPELSILERLLASPEWYQHPIFRNLVDLFSNQRHDIANKIFQDNEMIDPTMPVSDKNSLIAAAKSLKNKGLSNMDIFRGKSSREYDALKWVITYGDAEYIRNKKEPLGIQMKKFEDHVREKLSKQRFTSAQINEIMNTWQLFRRSYDSYLKLMMAPMIEMRNKIKYASKSEGKETDLYKKLDTDLSYMINQMNSWSGFYAPRERLPGKWVVYGLKGEGDKEKRFREHVGTRFEAEKLKDRYERMGYTVQPITEYNQMPEIVMQNLRQTHITQAIKNAIQSEKAKSKGNQDKIDLLNQLNQGVLNQVADIIQARGYLSSKMARITEHHITGYIEDPIERYLIYARNTSNGLAKSQVSQTAYEVLRHIDPMKSADENRLYNAASKYIEDNLRNIDKADRAVALAKSAATMKYLALNPRSLLVNATAVATTAPAAIHQYATGGKIGLHKIVASLASAGADFGKFMAGNRNFSKEEQQFLNDLIRSHYDNPQYTMDVMGNLQGSGSKLWNTAMRWGMTPFSLSERWNRGTTMLAAFRLARSQGKSYEEASKLARIASDKAHGIYGKATLPEIAQGTTLVARAAQMMYSYAKFGHNYVQMLYDLGFRKQNLQAFAYALLSPVVLAGGASLPFKDNIVYTVNWILRFLGIKEDSEKWWWDQTRKYLGKEGEKLGRHGIIGYMGADISSSLSINLGIPDTYSKLAGPVGGVAEDLSNVKKYTQAGEYSKAAESVLPNAVTNMLRAYRERQEGVTSRQGRRLWDESGKPFIPTTGQALLRATGFRPSEQAMLQERKFESQRVYDTFKEAHDNILEAIRAYLISPVKNPEKMVRITRQIEKYNQQVTSQGLVDQVPLITRNSIMTQLRGVSAPKKKEAARLRSQTL